jgi:hypothetical protein
MKSRVFATNSIFNDYGNCMIACVTDSVFVISRLKMNHKPIWAYVFVLEIDTFANSYGEFNVHTCYRGVFSWFFPNLLCVLFCRDFYVIDWHYTVFDKKHNAIPPAAIKCIPVAENATSCKKVTRCLRH